MVSPAPTPVVIAINARTADGQDPSWLWDVPFELLWGRPVTATGERGLDLAVRLHYGEVDHSLEPSVGEALRKVAAGQGLGGARRIVVVANYPAFHRPWPHCADASDAPGASAPAGSSNGGATP